MFWPPASTLPIVASGDACSLTSAMRKALRGMDVVLSADVHEGKRHAISHGLCGRFAARAAGGPGGPKTSSRLKQMSRNRQLLHASWRVFVASGKDPQ